MSGPDQDEAQEPQARPVYEPADIIVDMRPPAREVEALLRRYFKFPRALDEQVANVSQIVAKEMGKHFLGIHMMCINDAKGTA